MATASVTLALHQSTFLAGIARAQGAVNGLGASVGRIGARGFAIAGAAAVAFGTAAAFGIKKAFDLGGSLADMSAISGRSVKEILLLRRALEDAGVSMEKIDRFILTGQDKGQLIAKALKTISAGDWRDAAQSIGTQADILDKNSKTFDRISDLLGRSGDKLQGFFVGAAGKIAGALLPILERFDKLDFAEQGAKFGIGLLTGAQALVGFFQKPELLFQATFAYFRASILGIGNLLAAVFKTSVTLLQNGVQAVFEAMSSPNKSVFNLQIAAKTKVRDLFGKNMSGELNSYGRGLQKDIDILTKQSEQTQGPSVSERWEQINRERGTKLEVSDIFGAGAEMDLAKMNIDAAARLGRNTLPADMFATGSKRRGEIAIAGMGGGVDISEFARRDAERASDFGSRWSGPKADLGTGKTSKADVLLQKLSEQMDRQNQITEEAWATP